MPPFLQQKIGARKLLVYSESYGLNPIVCIKVVALQAHSLFRDHAHFLKFLKRALREQTTPMGGAFDRVE